MKKNSCKHDELIWVAYFGTCGYKWCILGEYHNHKECIECGYIEGELNV